MVAVPRISDDTRYARALEAAGRVKLREETTFRRRLAARVVGMVGVAMGRMGDRFDEDVLREELAGFEQAFVEESMHYISVVLVASGEIELAKRIGEMVDKIGLDELPPAFQDAFEEMSRRGLMEPYVGVPVPDAPPA